MGNIVENYNKIIYRIKNTCDKLDRNPEEVKLIAVSKTKPLDNIIEAYKCGSRYFGENYVQELREKQNLKNELSDLEWHFIGHLQKNKVKYIAEKVALIHSVDKESLAKEINKQAVKFDRVIDILVQVNTSGEKSKSGVSPEGLIELISKIRGYENIRLRGLMTIGGLGKQDYETRDEFLLLAKLLEDVNNSLGLDLKELSMGMSSDYEIAIECGATYIRVGSSIFGEREYN